MLILALFLFLGIFGRVQVPLLVKLPSFLLHCIGLIQLHKKALVYFHTIGTRLLTFRVIRVNNIFLL
mgnify:CR=1 FL=1